MMEILAGVTILIPVIMILRYVTRGKISMRLRYGLWLLVVLRLIVPMSIGNSMLSVMNLTEGMRTYTLGAAETERAGADRSALNMAALDKAGFADAADITDWTVDSENAGAEEEMADESDIGMMNADSDVIAESADDLSDGEVDTGIIQYAYTKLSVLGPIAASMRYVCLAVWLVGIIVVAGYMLAGQLRFVMYLRRTREPIDPDRLSDQWREKLTERGMRCYLIAGLPCPCMIGHSIYIDPQLSTEREKLAHVLAHEYAHALQGDTLWAAVRSVLCAVYWFHPLVWAAAYEAKQDSELACDERAIRLLGEQERFAYGRTLLDMVLDGHRQVGYAGVVLMMDGSGKRVRERVSMIAGGGKYSRVVAACVTAIAILLCGCAFTGAKQETTDNAPVLINEAEQSDTAAETEVQVDMAAETEAQGDIDGVEQKKLRLKEEAESLYTAEEEIQTRLKQIGEEWSQCIDQEFEELLFGMDDAGLTSVTTIDPMEYYDFFYNGAECPMNNGSWYLISRDEEWGIDFYGLYTYNYGCRGMKILIDGDVNTFDLPWVPGIAQSSVQVLQVEPAEDGTPRTFVFKTCMVNDSYHEIWQLNVADRYDTGTIEMSSFSAKDYQEQFRKLTKFRIDPEEQKVYVTRGENEPAGAVDISEYDQYTVDDVVWDGSTVGFRVEGQNADQLIFSTSIGLKLRGMYDVQYSGLSLIKCPVDIGTWGARCFVLGEPTVDTQYVNGSPQVLKQ